MKPQISLILPVYNAEKTIKEAIDSVINQSYDNLEIIIINDGSTDGSRDIITSYQDNRIKFIDNDGNRGLIYSLNRGLDYVSGKYIARMDADDIMLPDRLMLQFDFMEHNPDIDICGCSYEIFDEHGFNGKQFFWVSNDSIRAELMFNSPIAHPTYFIRTSAMSGYRYDDRFKYCEDYALLARFILDGHKAANLPRFLLRYRISENSQTQIGEKNALQRFESISQTQNMVLANGMGINNDTYHAKLHYALSQSDRIRSMSFTEFPVSVITNYFKKIERENTIKGFCNHKDLTLVLGKIWLKLILYKYRSSISDLAKLFCSNYTRHGVRYLFYRHRTYKK